jgi:hypothetical protein
MAPIANQQKDKRMKTTVNFDDFRDAFRTYDREHNFSYAGLRALFDYIEEYEADTGNEWELDVIALCCEYSESTWEDIAGDYEIDISACEDADDVADTVRDVLAYNTHIVGEVPGGCVYQAF